MVSIVRTSLIMCLAGMFLASCSAYERAGTKQRGKRGVHTRVVKAPDGEKIPITVKQPERQDMAKVSSPQRDASMQIVMQGLQHMQQRHLDQAVQTFQQAASLDGSNGVAYYYLAWTHFELKHFTQALGILDRAEALLSTTVEWELRITALREQIRHHSESTTHQPAPMTAQPL